MSTPINFTWSELALYFCWSGVVPVCIGDVYPTFGWLYISRALGKRKRIREADHFSLPFTTLYPNTYTKIFIYTLNRYDHAGPKITYT